MNSAVYYLKTVLGIDSFAAQPAEAAQVASLAQVSQPLAFMVHTPFAPSAVEKDMIMKMLGAIDIRKAQFLDQDSSAEIEGTASEKSFGVSFGLQPPRGISATWLELPAISQFLFESDKNKLSEVKKLAWAKLKSLKLKMGQV